MGVAPAGPGHIDPEPLAGESLARAAYDVARRLDPSAEGIHISEIEDGLAAARHGIRGDHPRSVLHSALNRAQNLFQKPARGTWRWIDPAAAFDPAIGLSGHDLADAAYDMALRLDPSRAGVHYEVIKESLQRDGVAVRGPNPGQTMAHALRNDGRFVSLGKGLWRWQ